MDQFDVVVIGGGPGGYPAAIRAAQKGKKVALIEKNKLGGTCLNRGCIPSKALIAGAELLHRIREAEEFGISVGATSFDYAKMVKRKDAVVGKIRRGLEGLIAANKITVIQGFGKFVGPKEIAVEGEKPTTIHAEKVIIATGSESRDIPAFPVDHKKILDSTDLLDLTTLPKKLAIIGGGIIGCEFASVWRELGVEITIFEMLPTILPMESKDVSSFLTRTFKKRDIKMETGVTVSGIEVQESGVRVKLADGRVEDADLALVAVGRKMNTSAIGLDKVGIKTNPDGTIPVNEHMETAVPGIYAIGDIASKWWLAHVATHQGLVAADHATGDTHAEMRYEAVPSAIFTYPEIATVGYSLEAAKEKGYDAVIGNFPFQALGKSQATHQTEGFAQIVVDRKTGQILGAQVIGHEASALIAEMAVAVANELTVECITETIHAHPTIAESWLEAALIAAETPVHFPPKAKA